MGGGHRIGLDRLADTGEVCRGPLQALVGALPVTPRLDEAVEHRLGAVAVSVKRDLVVVAVADRGHARVKLARALLGLLMLGPGACPPRYPRVTLSGATQRRLEKSTILGGPSLSGQPGADCSQPHRGRVGRTRTPVAAYGSDVSAVLSKEVFMTVLPVLDAAGRRRSPSSSSPGQPSERNEKGTSWH